ncbi:MAG: hypothetical protein ABFD60_07810 [Bryobacteraceae bacterium]
MAGVSIVYDEGKFTWGYTQGNFAATEVRLKIGTAPGVYSVTKPYAPDSTGDDVKNVLPAGSKGQFYAQMVAANAKGEGAKSVELPFDVGDGLPDGSWSFSIG